MILLLNRVINCCRCVYAVVVVVTSDYNRHNYTRGSDLLSDVINTLNASSLHNENCTEIAKWFIHELPREHLTFV